MNVLGIYANAERLQVAFVEISDHVNVLQTYDEPIAMGQLVPCMDRLLNNILMHKPEIDIVACPRGPSAFTSLRVVLSTVQGLAMGMNAKVFAPSTFDVLVTAYAGKLINGPLWVLIDSRSDFYYARRYDALDKGEQPFQMLKSDYANHIKPTDAVVIDMEQNDATISLAEILCMMDFDSCVSYKTLRADYMHLPNFKKKLR